MTIVEEKKSNKWIWIGLGGAVLFCLCAVGVAALLFMNIGQQFTEGMKTDPEGAAEAAHTIADYELPPGYQEQMSVNFFVYSMVVIGPGSMETPSPSTEPIIMLAQFQAGANQQQMEEQIRQSFEQQSGRRGLTLKIVETRKMTIRGKEVEVITYEGTDDKGLVMRQLITTFPGKDGTAMLMIMGNPEYWDKEEIDTFVESIH
ncbi:MAG: hypothetical protein EHM33_06020 [Chloroflexi bacterium]|nr:MAG: hypothetical protein EHM33_06020 [Chloroflexota bacterium]